MIGRRLRGMGRRRTARQPPPCVGCAKRSTDRLEPVEVEDVAGLDELTALRPVNALQSVLIDEQVVALDPTTGNRVLLNPSAALILTAFDRPRTVGEVVDQLSAETGVPRAQLVDDVIGTVARLQVRGILVDAVDDPVGRSDHAVRPTDVLDRSERKGKRNRKGVEAASVWAFDSGPRLIGGLRVAVRSRVDADGVGLDALVAAFPSVNGADRVVDLVADASGVAAALFDELDELVVDEAPGLRFHGGAVERAGRVVIVVGHSGQGKSTLTGALVASGFGYLTDEVVVVADTRVAPYSRPLDLDSESLGALGLDGPDVDGGDRKSKVMPGRLGRISDGGTPALIVVLTGESDPPGAAEVTEIPPAEAVMALLPHTFGATFADPDALGALADLCTSTRVVRLSRAAPEQMVDVVTRGL